MYAESMKWTAKQLELFGLTRTQTRVLNVLNAARTLPDAVRASGVSRTGTIYCLDQLRERGLVRRIKREKKLWYQALSAPELAEKLEVFSSELRASADGQQGKSIRMKASQGSEFVLYRGFDEILLAYERITTLNKDERLRVIQPNKSWMNLHKKLSPRQLIRVNNAIRDNRIILDAILQKNAYELYEEFFQHDPEKIREIATSFTGRMADYTVVAQTLFDYHAELWIFRQTALLINWEEAVALEITNENIVGFLRDFFEIAKASGTKVDHNRIMREMIERNISK